METATFPPPPPKWAMKGSIELRRARGETVIRRQAPGTLALRGMQIWISDAGGLGEIGPWRKEESDPSVCPEGRKDRKAC